MRLPQEFMSAKAVQEASAEIGLRGADDTDHTALTVPAYFRLRDVLHLTSLTRPTLYRRIAAGRFPPPVHLGGRICAWSRVALQTWIADPENYRTPQTQDGEGGRRRGRPGKYALT